MADPLALLEPQIADLGRIARVQVEIAPAVTEPLRISRPDDVSNAQWLEEVLAGELKGGLRICQQIVGPPRLVRFAPVRGNERNILTIENAKDRLGAST